jgi:DNA (cytosine-5)-methyltransferase 1
MTRPLLLDLFCGAGGGAMGYHRAGFDVVGVDIKPQPRYPFEFIQGDVFEEWFDLSAVTAIHASPPCRDHSRLVQLHGTNETGWMLAETREMLQEFGKPWIIENVARAPMRADFKLCGCQFGLPRLRRERWFETSPQMFDLRPPCRHSGYAVTVAGHPGGSTVAGGGISVALSADWRLAMGIDWMTSAELAQAIPPDYTEYIGGQLLEHLESQRESFA